MASPNEYEALFADEEARMQTAARTPVAGSDEYVGLFDERDVRLGASLRRGLSVAPEKAATLTNLSRASGVPLPVVERNEEHVAQRLREDELRALAATSPILRRQLEDPTFAGLAQDDGPTLAAIANKVAPSVVTSKEFTRLVQKAMRDNPLLGPGEARMAVSNRVTVDNSPGGIRASEAPPSTLNNLAAGVRSSFVEGFEQTRQGVRRLFGDVTGFEGMAGDAARRAQQSQHRQFLATPRPEGLAGDVYAGIQSTVQSAPGIAAALVNPALGLGLFGVQAGAPAYDRYRTRGGSVAEASLGAALEGTAEILGEKLPLDYIVKSFGRAGAGQFISGLIAREVPSEIATTIAQGLTDVSIANPNATLSQWAAGLPDDIRQTVVATIVQATVLGGAGHVVRRFELRGQEAERAERSAAGLTELAQLAAASKLRTRDVSSFENFMRDVADGALVDELYLSTQTLQQAGIDPAALAAVSPAVAEQLLEAQQTGGDLVIPVAEFAAKLAGTDVGNALVPHLRTDPDAMSQAEAQTFYQDQAPELQAQVEQALEAHAGNTELQAQTDTIRAHFEEQLKSANRFTSDVNNAYATLASSFYTTMAGRLGITPTEMLARYPLQVKAEAIDGAQALEQPAYHGSPHLFDVFSLDRIGTGEGAQAYGWGLYFAENQGIAEGYQRKLSEATYFIDGQRIVENNPTHVAAAMLVEHNGDRAAAAQVLRAEALTSYAMDAKPIWVAAAELLESGAELPTAEKRQGSLYQVDIPDEATARMLDWDKPLAEQAQVLHALTPEAMGLTFRQLDSGYMAFVNAANRPIGTMQKGGTQESFRARWAQHLSEAKTGQELYKRLALTSREASEALNAAGIPGIKYLDASSRAQQTRVFDADGNRVTVNGDAFAFANGFENLDAAITEARRQAESYSGMQRIVEELQDWQAKGYTLREDVTRNIVVFDDALVKITHRDGTPVTPEERQQLLQGERGQISFGADIKQGATLSLLKHADLSTFLHESGHFYFEVLRDIASRPDAPAQITADMAALLKHVGVASLDQWNAMTFEQRRAGHETVARSFEAYLFEGKAPSIELQGLFQRFRAWLVNVYRQLTALNVELSDDVRRVFDRLLAADNVIAEAEAARGYSPLFKTAAEAGMTAEEWAAYQALGAEATEAASENLQGRGLRDMRWLRNARGRVLRELQRDARAKRAAVQAEIEAELPTTDPVYAVQRFLSRGELPEGIVLPDGAGHRLDMGALREMYGDGPAAPWRYLSTGQYGVVAAENGLHPDMVADLFGFASGDDLVRALLASEPLRSKIEGLTDRRMLERYGDLSSEEAIDRAADAAIHNEARGKFVATEFDALARATGQPSVLARAARMLAREAVGRRQIAKLRPSQHLAAEARAGRAAQAAMRKGDLVEAATEKRNQLFNLQAYRAARDAQQDVERELRYLRTFNSEGTRKAIEPEYRDQIDQLLERYDLRAISDKEAGRRASLLAWIESQRLNGIEPNIPDELLNEANRRPYRMLTVEEFRGLVETIRQIEHLGRLKHTLLTARDQRAFEVVRDEIVASIHANARGAVSLREQRSVLGSIASGGKRILAAHRKFPSIARELDGFQDGGPVWQHLVRAMNERGDQEATMREQATVRLTALFRPILKGEKLGGRGTRIDALGIALNREERLAVALNAGNASNLQRLIGGGQDGRVWSPEQVQAVLDTLTKEEWDFVQATWDFFESYRPQIAAKEKRVYGIEPEWIQATPVQTKFGTYRGGYYPIKYDPRQSVRAEEHADAEGARQMLGSAYTSATTRRSFTKARVEEVNLRPLRLSLDTIFQGTNEVIHDLAWHEWLIDANRLLRSQPLDQAIRRHYGPEVVQALKSTVRDIAAGDLPAQAAAERFLNHVRHGATIAGLGWNLMTSLLQPIGLTQSMVRIGPNWVARGIADWLGSPAKMSDTVETIYQRSEFMRLRGKTMQREINELQNTIAGRSSALQASYFYLIQKAQLVADVPTWLGAYHKAIDAQQDEASAVALADQAVIDSQGGGQIKDLAEVQRGGAVWKLFTNFYSFFSTTYNLAVERTKATNPANPAELGRLAVDYLLLFVVPATLGGLLRAALKGEADDEDELLKRLAAENISYLLGTMVLLREVAPAVQAAAGVNEFNLGYGGPAGLRFFTELNKLGQQVGQGDVDAAMLKALNNTAGVLFHYPAGQVNRTVEGVAAMVEGRTENPAALILGPARDER